MRTLIILIFGLVLWGGCLGVTRLLGDTGPSKMSLATYVFIALWFLISAGNMWVGVAQAGYSVKEELPIFFLIFSLPVAVALFVQWKFL
jgi:hypothetical protein